MTILDLAEQLLAECGSERLVVRGPGVKVLIRAVRPCQCKPAVVVAPATVGNNESAGIDEPTLSRVQRKLVDKATSIPITVRKLINLSGYEFNSWSRSQVTFLCREGYLDRVPDGIRLDRRVHAGGRRQ